MSPEKLKMTFDPNTIDHLGARMYSTLPPVLAELIANAHDADAENVTLKLNDANKQQKEIVIEDDGIGMAFNEINDKFLRIGRNRRTEDETSTTPKGREIIGKKGLGKLSFFGIAHEIEIDTRKNGKKTVFQMTWQDIKNETGDYEPEIIKNENCLPNEHGTKITLRKIQRKTNFSPSSTLAQSLSKMFIIDPDFEISIQQNAEQPIIVLNEMRYANLQKEVEWTIPDDYENSGDYNKANQVVGYLIAAEKPIPPKTNMRGIVLFSRKKMVNAPEYFSDSTSSHFFSYLTGELTVDFIDKLEDDVIATNRQSLNWEHEEMQKLRTHLCTLVNWLEKDWRKKREIKRRKNLSKTTAIDVSKWLGHVPENVGKNLESIIQLIMQDSELPREAHPKIIEKIHELVPEYPKYHWRHLHQEIKQASETDYQKEDYYRAFQEAAKRYINAVKEKSGNTNTSEAGMMGQVFGIDEKSVLQVAKKFKKPDGNNFQSTTINNVEEGQKFLSMGVVSGCRNPVSHEEVADLIDSGLFTEKDCLDALSLLSHLFSRLDSSQTKT